MRWWERLSQPIYKTVGRTHETLVTWVETEDREVVKIGCSKGARRPVIATSHMRRNAVDAIALKETTR